MNEKLLKQKWKRKIKKLKKKCKIRRRKRKHLLAVNTFKSFTQKCPKIRKLNMIVSTIRSGKRKSGPKASKFLHYFSYKLNKFLFRLAQIS